MANTPGKGTLAKLEISSVFTSIGKVTSIKVPVSSTEMIDITELTDSTKKVLPGLQTNDELVISGNFDPADTTHIKIKTDQDAGTSGNWKIIFADPGAAEMTFAGYVSKYMVGEAKQNGVVPFEFTVTVNGAVTYTP